MGDHSRELQRSDTQLSCRVGSLLLQCIIQSESAINYFPHKSRRDNQLCSFAAMASYCWWSAMKLHSICSLNSWSNGNWPGHWQTIKTCRNAMELCNSDYPQRYQPAATQDTILWADGTRIIVSSGQFVRLLPAFTDRFSQQVWCCCELLQCNNNQTFIHTLLHNNNFKHEFVQVSRYLSVSGELWPWCPITIGIIIPSVNKHNVMSCHVRPSHTLTFTPSSCKLSTSDIRVFKSHEDSQYLEYYSFYWSWSLMVTGNLEQVWALGGDLRPIICLSIIHWEADWLWLWCCNDAVWVDPGLSSFPFISTLLSVSLPPSGHRVFSALSIVRQSRVSQIALSSKSCFN